MSTMEELACTYAAILLSDDGIPVTAEKIATVVKAAGVNVESYWPSLFAKLVEKRGVEDLITTLGSGRVAAQATVAASCGAAAAPAPPPEEKRKDDPLEESDEGIITIAIEDGIEHLQLLGEGLTMSMDYPTLKKKGTVQNPAVMAVVRGRSYGSTMGRIRVVGQLLCCILLAQLVFPTQADLDGPNFDQWDSVFSSAGQVNWPVLIVIAIFICTLLAFVGFFIWLKWFRTGASDPQPIEIEMQPVPQALNPQTIGVSVVVVQEFPLRQYFTDDGNTSQETECSICLEQLVDGEYDSPLWAWFSSSMHFRLVNQSRHMSNLPPRL